MVSYYTPSGIAMFTGSNRGHYHPHHHHSPPAQGGYFTPGAAAAYTAYHPHGPHHQPTNISNASPLASMGVGVGIGAVPSTQFSPPGADCNHPGGPSGYPHPHSHQFNTAAVIADTWAAQQSYNSACAARGAAATMGYEEWGGHHHMAMTPHGHPHHHSAFYHHAQPSPQSSTPSPHTQAHLNSGGGASNNNNTTPHSPNNYSNTTPNGTSPSFKTEFGPCSGGNQDSQQELSSSQVGVQSNANNNAATPHSPDSGMAISDGVSSSGSPATTGGSGAGGNNGGGLYGPANGVVQCLGGPSSSGAGSSASMSSSSASSNGEMHLHLQQGSHQYNLTHSHSHTHMPSPLLNVGNNGRPTQARSPYEWMKKPTYSSVPTSSSSSSNNAKTRTKDKYRVVYSDTQRLELEKEFHYSRYITIRRKSELAVTLGLSERQVKIWFQNRRAKERKIHRKRDEMMGREKLGTMVHMQNVMPGMGPNPMCNQSIPLM